MKDTRCTLFTEIFTFCYGCHIQTFHKNETNSSFQRHISRQNQIFWASKVPCWMTASCLKITTPHNFREFLWRKTWISDVSRRRQNESESETEIKSADTFWNCFFLCFMNHGRKQAAFPSDPVSSINGIGTVRYAERAHTYCILGLSQTLLWPQA
jgi:hypothetical protein